MWAGGGVGSPRRGPAPAPTDDLFARKLRQPARPPLTPHTFEPRPTRGPLVRSGSDAGEARPPTPASPRARAHSHEEASRPAAPPARFFSDPLALLGLPAEEPEPEFPPVPEPRCFAHYDVQSLLFDWSPRPRGHGAQAEAGSGTPAAAQDQTASSDLLLEAPGFVSELGGEGELGLGGPVSPPVPPSLPNAAVSVLEEPQNRTSAYSLEHADLGAGYYRKYFYGKEHQNFFGLDEALGPVAVSLRREEKESSGGGTLHSYRIIVRTTQLRTLRGTISEDALPPGPPRGLSPRKLLEHVAPRLSPTCLRLGSASPKVPRTLLTLDEQVLSFQRKVGILYCRAGQGSEEEMYNNQEAGPAFMQFLTLLGDVVRLKGFESYRAQLDTKSEAQGVGVGWGGQRPVLKGRLPWQELAASSDFCLILSSGRGRGWRVLWVGRGRAAGVAKAGRGWECPPKLWCPTAGAGPWGFLGTTSPYPPNTAPVQPQPVVLERSQGSWEVTSCLPSPLSCSTHAGA